MNDKKWFIVIAVVLAVVITGAVVLHLNSYDTVLKRAGFTAPTELYRGMDNDGKEYRVVAEYPFEDSPVVAYLTNTFPGFWKIRNSERMTDDTGVLTFTWMQYTNIIRHSTTDPVVTELEEHQIVCGSNAIKQIVIPGEILPDNVTVSIRQTGNAYILHFITFGGVDTMNKIDAAEILKVTGCT